MKKIDVTQTDKSKKKSPWMPWGTPGVIWRWLLFTALLVGLCFLLALLKGCDRHGRNAHSAANDDYFREFGDAVEIPRWNPDEIGEIIGGSPDTKPFEPNIPNPVKELPGPDDNIIRDVPGDQIGESPSNPYRRAVSNKLNVILDSGSDDETYNTFARRFKELYPSAEYAVVYYNKFTKLVQITVEPSRREYVHDNLNAQIPEIDFKVFYEEIMTSSASGSDHNDPAFADKKQSWYFAPIQAYDAWEITKGNPEVVVAVIDNYIDVTHPELRDRIKDPYNVGQQNRDVMPPVGAAYSFSDDNTGMYHGTHVSATAVGALDNGQGTSGIAPQCTLMPISLGEQITTMKILDGLLYAIHSGADVVNLSLGNYYSDGILSMPVEEQLRQAENQGKYVEGIWDYVFDLADKNNCTLVWAGGNQGVITGLDEFKRNGATIRVSALDRDLNLADFSNFGRYENMGINYSDVSAPGVDIYNAGPANNYGYSDGTSMAAPIVTGAIALMKSLNPKLTNKEIAEIINQTSRPLQTKYHAGGVLQIKDALLRVKDSMANFDEIKADRNKIIGDWETTEMQEVITNGVKQDFKTHIIYSFKTPESGTITYREETGHDYTAPISARILDDRIEVEQMGFASSSTSSNQYIPMTITGRRGPDGTLECSRATSSQPFYLIRVSA